jgi:hypothetical protein
MNRWTLLGPVAMIAAVVAAQPTAPRALVHIDNIGMIKPGLDHTTGLGATK